MGKALPSYKYGDPANCVDRIRSEDAARIKRKEKRDAEKSPLELELKNWREKRGKTGGM